MIVEMFIHFNLLILKRKINKTIHILVRNTDFTGQRFSSQTHKHHPFAVLYCLVWRPEPFCQVNMLTNADKIKPRQPVRGRTQYFTTTKIAFHSCQYQLDSQSCAVCISHCFGGPQVLKISWYLVKLTNQWKLTLRTMIKRP